MSIWFMHDNHTFTRLDTLSVDEAMERLEALVEEEGGSGFVGTKGNTPGTSIQWRKGEPWRVQVRALLQGAMGLAPAEGGMHGADVPRITPEDLATVRAIQAEADAIGAADAARRARLGLTDVEEKRDQK